MRCSRCGAENRKAARFCDSCGKAFRQANNTEDAATPTGAERRHLTVLFCDLVGSTGLAARLDPEEWREIVASYHHAAAEAITRFGGHVAQYLGDGVMAYFGWPEAHDNAAESAARAGLSIIYQIRKLKPHAAQVELSARVGIDSGAVVVGAGAGKDADVFGDVPNIAARAQAATEPNTVVVTGATQQLISGLFVVEDRGAQILRGIERPVQLFRLIRPSSARGRLEAVAAAGGMTQFVGREQEVRLLMNSWERTLTGKSQAVLIIGEPGIGKSRLVQQFHQLIAGSPHAWAEATASRFFQNTPFYAVADTIRTLQEIFSLARVSAAQGRSRRRTGPVNAEGSNGQFTNRALAKIEEPVERLRSALEWELDPSVAQLVLAARGDEPAPQFASSERRRLISAVVKWVLSATEVMPVVIAIEDLHWADPSTLELIELLVQQSGNVPLMLLQTARPEFHARQRPSAHLVRISLNPLNPNSARMIVDRVAGQTILPEDTTKAVVERAGGVPLFVEELTRVVLESGNVDRAAQAIPATLHDSLMARLDRLGPARETLQLGAVLGTEFPYELLRAVSPLNEDELRRHLLILKDAELLYEITLEPNASYQFKHVLIRDVAYEALLKSRRRELHTHIAKTIEQRFPELTAARPEILAYHYTEAGLRAQAVHYLGEAGKVAIARSAHAEAIGHIRRGLELLGTVPQTSERDAEELRLQLMLTSPLAATKGYSHSEVEQACNRAKNLSEHLIESPRLFAVLGGLFSVYHNRGEFAAALGLAQRMLALAERQMDARLLVWAHYSLGFNLQAQGDFPAARFHLEQSIALYRLDRSQSYGWVQNPGPTALGMLAHVLCSLGYPDQGLRCAEEGVALARSLGHPYTLAWILGSIAAVLIRRGDYREAKQLVEERIALCTQHGFSTGLSEATVHHGFILVQLGRLDEGVVEMRKGLEIDSRTPANQTRLYEQYLVSIALAKIGRRSEALAVIDPLLLVLEQTSENSGIKVDVCILKGDLLLMEGPSRRADAVAHYRRAIELARQNSDKTAELEATRRIARLLGEQQRRDEARALLAEIYNWFTEGFDTADLKEAKALLDELSD